MGENAKNWNIIMAMLLSIGRVYKCVSAEERFVCVEITSFISLMKE